MDKFDFLIVGAGLSGSTIAERLASQLNKKILIVEKRNHIGGNVYDYYNEDGILVQKYGPHIFHTNYKYVWDYLCQFTEFNNYVHRVIAVVNKKEVYLPINIDTMEKLLGRKFTPKSLKEYFETKKVKIDKIKNAKDVITSQVGEELYELFFKNYTKKQWGVYPEELDPEVTQRLPVRFNRDTRYFADKYQGIPKYGYTKMIEKMLSHRNIHILLNTNYRDILNYLKFDKIIFTGQIDYYFNYKYGSLPFRSIEFEFKTLEKEYFQNAAQVNYPNDFAYTRITEFKHLYFQNHHKTTICYEYPQDEGEPYYPMPISNCKEIYLKYKRRADMLKNVYFLGRLAEYRYINMDQAVMGALNLFGRLKDE